MGTKRSAPSLALEAAALAYAEALASRRNEEASLIAAHRARTGHRRGALDTLEAEERLGLCDAVVMRASAALGRAAVALWKAERRRGAARG